MVCGFILSMSASSIHFARWRWNRAKSLNVAFNCPSVAMAARDSNSAALLKHSRTVVMGYWPRISAGHSTLIGKQLRGIRGGADKDSFSPQPRGTVLDSCGGDAVIR